MPFPAAQALYSHLAALPIRMAVEFELRVAEGPFCHSFHLSDLELAAMVLTPERVCHAQGLGQLVARVQGAGRREREINFFLGCMIKKCCVVRQYAKGYMTERLIGRETRFQNGG